MTSYKRSGHRDIMSPFIRWQTLRVRVPTRCTRSFRDTSTIGHMARNRPRLLLFMAKIWAYPLWCSVIRGKNAAAVFEDVDWWMCCINRPDLLALDRYSRFAYLAGALTEFRTLMHYRLRPAPAAVRAVLRAVYRPAATLSLEADRIGAGLFIQHGVATIVDAESIGHHCWINQLVTIGHNSKGRPTLGDNVRVGTGAVVIGPITLHNGSTVGANATVIYDVGPGQTVVAPLARPLGRADM